MRPLSAAAPIARAGLLLSVLSYLEGERNSRDGSEHALVNGKEEIRDLGTTNTRLIQHVPEPDVLEIPDVGVGSVGEGQGVTPEKPLERHDTDGH
jgi:hypothetical protein